MISLVLAVTLAHAAHKENHDIVLSEAGSAVQVAKAEPPAGAVEVGPVSGTAGKGCGAFGYLGDYENARNALRNAAADLGADFVRMDVIKEPYMISQYCYLDEYVIRGVAFRVPLAPAPPIAAQPLAGSGGNTASGPPPIEAYALADQVYAMLGRTHPASLEAWSADVRAVWTRMQAGAGSDLVVTAARAGGEKIGKDADLTAILAAGFGS